MSTRLTAKQQAALDAWRALEAEGRTPSYPLLAERLQVSRNAVAGLVNRLRAVGYLPEGRKTDTGTSGDTPDDPRNTAAVATDDVEEPEPEAPMRRMPEKGVPVEQLSAKGCRWPLDRRDGVTEPERLPYGFCDARAIRGPYCAIHAKRAYRKRDEPDPLDSDQENGEAVA